MKQIKAQNAKSKLLGPLFKTLTPFILTCYSKLQTKIQLFQILWSF
jgi:hypothetical protein